MTVENPNRPTRTGFAVGATFAAAIILVAAGLLSLLQGIAAVAKDELFVAGIEYTYEFDLTTWGWIHIVVGVLAVAIGLGLFTGAMWARVAGLIIAAISIVINFLWLPYYPLWGVVVIALDLVIMWAIVAWRDDR